MVSIIKRDGNGGITLRSSGRSSRENHILHGRTAKLLYLLLSQNPTNRIGNVGLAGAVRTDNPGDSGRKIKYCFICKRLKSLNLNRF